jgi:hypothetical protein
MSRLQPLFFALGSLLLVPSLGTAAPTVKTTKTTKAKLPKTSLPTGAVEITLTTLVDAAKKAGVTKTETPSVTEVRTVSATTPSVGGVQLIAHCAYSFDPAPVGEPGTIQFHRDMGGVCDKPKVTLQFFTQPGDVHVVSCETNTQALWKVVIDRNWGADITEKPATREGIHTVVLGSVGQDVFNVTFQPTGSSSDWNHWLTSLSECKVAKVHG